MNIPFTKMQALGNDFAVIDGVSHPVALTRAQIQLMADRHFGIGFDQLLLLEPARTPDADFNYRIFNADGGEVEQCGNGARCLGRFIHENGLSAKTSFTVATLAGKLQIRLEANNTVNVAMGIPVFEPAQIPFIMAAQALRYDLPVEGQTVEIGAVNIGNPHAVIAVADVDTAPVRQLGTKIEKHPLFPRGVNVGFMQIVDPEQIRLRVYERGAGETLACGSGACAAVVIGNSRGLLADKVTVKLPGGALSVSWSGPGTAVWLAGPAETVFTGEWLSQKRIAS